MSSQDSIKKDEVPSWRLKEWFPSLSSQAHDLLKKYFIELLKFNKTINLISPKTVQQADSIHFADSVYSCEIVHKNIIKNKSLYDIGSGNGFPGVIYAILFPEQEVILVDSDERKCEFLRHIQAVLGLNNIKIKNVKIELLGENSVEQAICRAFSPLPKTILLLRKIVVKGGAVYHLKSEEWAGEVSQIPIQLCSIWQPVLVSGYPLPTNDAKRYVVKTEKIA